MYLVHNEKIDWPFESLSERQDKWAFRIFSEISIIGTNTDPRQTNTWHDKPYI